MSIIIIASISWKCNMYNIIHINITNTFEPYYYIVITLYVLCYKNVYKWRFLDVLSSKLIKNYLKGIFFASI